jgi:hypothetical protein
MAKSFSAAGPVLGLVRNWERSVAGLTPSGSSQSAVHICKQLDLMQGTLHYSSNMSDVLWELRKGND